MKTTKLSFSLAVSILAGMLVMNSCGSPEVEETPVAEQEVTSYTGELKVVATGEKNESSESSEVWILNLNTDLEQIDSLFKSAVIDSNWVKSGDRVVAVKWPATIRYEVEALEQISLRLYRHSWSGKAEVYYKDQLVENLDLYSTDSVKNYIDITIDPSKY